MLGRASGREVRAVTDPHCTGCEKATTHIEEQVLGDSLTVIVLPKRHDEPETPAVFDKWMLDPRQPA